MGDEVRLPYLISVSTSKMFTPFSEHYPSYPWHLKRRNGFGICKLLRILVVKSASSVLEENLAHKNVQDRPVYHHNLEIHLVSCCARRNECL